MAVSLSKGQKIELAKRGSEGLSKIFMGLGWDVAKPTGLMRIFSSSESIDLDASCLMFDANKNLVDVVWFRQLTSRDGSVRHGGDNLTGAGDGDDEVIYLDLEALPAEVVSLVFTVNSFRGQTFSKVANASCRLVDAAANVELARLDLTAAGGHTGLVMCRVYRQDGQWKLHSIGETASGRTAQDMAFEAVRYF
jgi:tellurium resistance protein TerZ